MSATDPFNLTREDLRHSPNLHSRETPAPSSDGADSSYNAHDILAAQDALEAEAREVLPFTFDTCTSNEGYIKQPVFACLTCLNWGGVCAACSIACHGEHELVELFSRRNFRCDCGTEKMGAGSKCSLSGLDDASPNYDNHYDKNFKGVFCICGRIYNPHTETDMMYQCQVCEDWLHHGCLLGAPQESGTTPLGTDDFDMLICSGCVTTNKPLRAILSRWAGVTGSGVIVVDEEDRILGRATLEDEDEEVPKPALGGEKRGAGDAPASDTEEPPAKKLKREDLKTDVKDEGDSSSSDSHPSSDAITSTSTQSSSSISTAASSSLASATTKGCKAPPALAKGESMIDKMEKAGARCNVYLEEGWMERWCRCEKCLPTFAKFPYLLVEELTFEPPEDPDAHRSTMELGMEALNRLPRAQAIEGAMAFSGLTERLKTYLKPYSDAGTTVTKEMVDEFFRREKELRNGH